MHERAVIRPPNEQLDEDVAQKLVEGSRSALAKLESDELPDMTMAEAAGLEVVVLTQDRPSVNVTHGFIDIEHKHVGVWQGRLQLMETSIRKVIAAVGGIRVPGHLEPVATAFVIAPGLLITNRHVLEGIADAIGQKWILRRPNDTTIDFIGEAESGRKTSFKVKGVRYAGPDAIKGHIDLRKLDLAVLIVDPDSDTGFPDAIKFSPARDIVHTDRNVCVIGFPARPEVVPGEGHVPSPGTETQQVVNGTFDDKLGVKKLAPGEIDLGIGEHSQDVRKWIFTHDASTLMGNSGSCIIDLTTEGTPAIGIHFGGLPRDENYAHAAAALQQQLVDLNATFV
jgi:hypothetical protein